MCKLFELITIRKYHLFTFRFIDVNSKLIDVRLRYAGARNFYKFSRALMSIKSQVLMINIFQQT